MSLYKPKGSKYWWYDFRYKGVRHRDTTKCEKRQDAAEVEAAYKTQLAKGEVGIETAEPAPDLKTAIDDFLDWSAINNEEGTTRKYTTNSKAILKYFGDSMSTAGFKFKNIDDFVKWRLKQKKKAPYHLLKNNAKLVTNHFIKPATVNGELAFLKGVFTRLVANETFKTNPLAGYPLLKEGRAWTVISYEEEAKYLAKASQPLRDVSMIMLATGMRPEEIYWLEKDHVSFGERGLIDIRKSKTEAGIRKLRMPTGPVREIFERRVATSPSKYVFAGGRWQDSDKPLVKLTNPHHEAREEAGLRLFRQYDLRHTFATRAVENGMDLMTLKNILGHAHMSMVLRYAHPSDDHNFEAMRKFEEAQFAKQGVTAEDWPALIS